MSDSADDQFPAWLGFNSSCRSLSGVPLPGDEGVLRLTFTATCKHTPGHTGIHSPECDDNTPEVFELTVSRCPWANSQVSSVSVGGPVLEVETETPRVGCAVSQAMSADAVCQGAPVVASLVLCSTSDQLTPRDRLDLMFHLSEFLTIPVSSVMLEPSSTRLLAAIEHGFQMVSAGPGLGDVCHLSQTMELLWWLPCAAVKHLNDFIRVLQHNVDGGRLQREIGTTILGWYIASSNSMVTRQSRRRRAAGYQTVAPTPVLSPLKPTSLVASGQVDSSDTSSTDMSSPTVPAAVSSPTVPAAVSSLTVSAAVSSLTVSAAVSSLTVSAAVSSRTVSAAASSRTVSTYLSSQVVWSSTDYYNFPEPGKQIEAGISPPTVVSEPPTLVVPSNLAETTQPKSVSHLSSSADMTSSSSATMKSSQLLTQAPRTPQVYEQHHISTAHLETNATLSYLSTQQDIDRHFIPSLSTPDLPASYVRQTPNLSPTVTTLHQHELNPTSSTSWQPVRQSPVDTSGHLSSWQPVRQSPVDTSGHLSSWQPIRQSPVDTSGHLSSWQPIRQSPVDTSGHLSSWQPIRQSPVDTSGHLSSWQPIRQSPVDTSGHLSSWQPIRQSPVDTSGHLSSWQPVRQSPVDTSGHLSSWQPDRLYPVDTAISSVTSDTAISSVTSDTAISSVTSDEASDLWPWQRALTGARLHATVADEVRVYSSPLYSSSTTIDWLQEMETETSPSEDMFLFDDIQTVPLPEQMQVPEYTATPEVWFQPSQMSDSLTLLSSLASPSSLTSAYFVLSRDVEVIAPLFTSTGSVLDLWTDVFPSASGSTSATSDRVTYFDGSDWRGKYNSPSFIDPVWDAVIHTYSNIPVWPTQQPYGEHSAALDQIHWWRPSSIPQLPRLSHSAQIQTHSKDLLHPLDTSYRSVSASEIVADWRLVESSSDSKTSTVEAVREHPQLAVVTSITSPADSSNSFIATLVSSSAMSSSADPSTQDDKTDHTTVTTEIVVSSAARPGSDTTSISTGVATNTTSISAGVATNTTSITTGVTANTTSVTTPVSSPFILVTSAATKRHRPRTTVTRAKTTAAATTTTVTTTVTTATTTTTTATTTITTKRPSVRKSSTHKLIPATHRTTPGWGDEDEVYPDYFNNRPYVQRPIKVIRADQGRLLEFMVPHDVFYDIEDGDTRHLSLSLELPSNQMLPDNFWLYIESAQQVIKALPLHEDMDVKNMSVALVARDKQGLAAADYITLQINDTPRRSFTHVMKFAIAFLQFMHSRRNITELMERVGSYFGDDGAKMLTVLEVRQGSFVMSWTNHSLAGATCPTDAVRQLYAHMVRKDGTVRQTFSRHIGRHLHLKEVQLQPWGSCLTPVTTTLPSSSTKSTSTHLVSEIKAGHGFSVWAHVILPVLIAVLVFILIILIIIFCNRRRRQQQAPLNTEKEAISFDGNPIIFPSECVPEDLSTKPRDPQVPPAPADPQANQNISAGSSQVKNNLNRDQERARRSRDNREQQWLNKDTEIHDQECERDWSRNFHRKHAKDSSSGRRQRDADRTSRVSASSTLSWDRPNNHYLEEEAGSRSSTLKSTKSAGSDKRHRRSPPPYWQHHTDPPPYRMPPPYLSNNSAQM